ncbi:Paratox [Streptococcus orisratti]|uniref:competence regulator inhibitor paratox n=1 Tax=Streptococcus orisratti TaxID=114652 RepID=UPI0023F6C662|nr:Paratox [Streptococcus orisratti]
MLHYDELKQAVDNGYVKGDEVSVVRKEGKIFDYVLPNEPVKPWEVVTVESLSEVLSELSESE